MQVLYWNSETECQDREALARKQLEDLRTTVDTALKAPFYRDRLRREGIESGEDIRSMEDFSRIPFTTKDDLREAFPYGMLAVPRENVVRLHASSGTTGIPTVIYHTREDLANWTELSARSMAAHGRAQTSPDEPGPGVDH